MRYGWLYVPGSDQRKLARALRAPAATVIADLEDAVPPSRRAHACEIVRDWLGVDSDVGAPRWIRVAAEDPDVLRLAWAPGCAGVLVAKTNQPAELAAIADTLAALEREAGEGTQPTAVAPLIESAAGLLVAPALARMPRVVHLHLGEVDLAAELGIDPDDDLAMSWARGTVVAASAAAGLPAPIGPISAKIHDEPSLERSSRLLRRLGFGGRAAIHPDQLGAVDRAFAPTRAELAAAQDALDAAEAAAREGEGVAVDGSGRMVDEAVLRRARAVQAAGDPHQEVDRRPTPRPAGGRLFEDFRTGEVFEHELGRTITSADNIWVTLLSQNTAPLHFDHHYAGSTEFGRPLVNSVLTLAVVTGQSVADVSQNVLANLGWDEVRLPHPVLEGDTLYSRSTVVSTRLSRSRPNAGVLVVDTVGFNQHGTVVISFKRTMLVYRRGHAPSGSRPEVRA